MNSLHFRNFFLSWYYSNKRDLPWRNNPAPYNVWISEVIFQQTRINQGMQYYLRFIEQFPELKTLATASEDEVLKMWQGLGYYSRARNLHETSKKIFFGLNGVFPSCYNELKKLKGIGEYTAAAIASIAFNETVPAIDGNVYRVLSRIFSIDKPIDSSDGKKYFKNLASKLIDPDNPGDFNQALMEFGALQCIPQNPDCLACPLKIECTAFRNNTVSLFPVKNNTQKIRNRYFNYLVITYNNLIAFNKRTGNDIWKNLYDFPMIETSQYFLPEKFLKTDELTNFFKGSKVNITNISDEITHQLSHQKIHARFYHITSDIIYSFQHPFITVSKNEILKLPVPKIIEKHLVLFNLIK